MRLIIAIAALLAVVSAGAHSVSLSRQVRRISDEHAAKAPAGKAFKIGGNIWHTAEYWTTVGIGEPAQPFRVQLDTGSSSLAVPNTKCGKLPNTLCEQSCHAPYDPSKSSTAQGAVKCGSKPGMCPQCSQIQGAGDVCAFDVHYGDGSGFYGGMFNDTVTIGSQKASGVTFATQFDITPMTGFTLASGGFEASNLDGIMGVAFGTINQNIQDEKKFKDTVPFAQPTVLDQFAAQGQYDNKFGFCLTPEGGVWDLGFFDVENKVYGDEMQLTHVLKTNHFPAVGHNKTERNNPANWKNEFYTVNLRNIALSSPAGKTDLRSYVFNNSIDSPYKYGSIPGIVDSGTTLLALSDKTFQAFNDTVKSLGVSGWESVFGWDGSGLVPSAAILQWPDLEFTFKGTDDKDFTLTLPPAAYFYDAHVCGDTSGNQVACSQAGAIEAWALGVSPGLDQYTSPILGDIFMQNFYVTFDQTTTPPQVGFGKVKACIGSTKASSVDTPCVSVLQPRHIPAKKHKLAYIIVASVVFGIIVLAFIKFLFHQAGQAAPIGYDEMVAKKQGAERAGILQSDDADGLSYGNVKVHDGYNALGDGSIN